MTNVRRLRRSDRKQLAHLLQSDEFALPDLAFRVERGYDHSPWLVATDGGSVVGFLQGHHGSLFDERVGYGDVPGSWINWLGVHQGQRLRGVAAALVHQFATSALEEGDGHIACLVDQRTPTLDRLSFFSRIGMEPVFADDPDDLVAGPTTTVIRLTA